MPNKPAPFTQKMVDEHMQPLSTQIDPETGKPRPRSMINDGGCVGLSLRSGKGTPTWIVRATTGGILRKVIGDPRSMSLDIARQIVVEARELHHAGGDVSDEWILAAQARHGILPPVDDPYREPDGPWTWRQGAEAWFQQLRRRRRSEVTITAYRKGLLTQLGTFSDRLIKDVRLEDVQEEIDRLSMRTPALAVQAYKAARPFSQFASIGPARLKTEVTSHPFKRLILPKPVRSQASSKATLEPVDIGKVARLIAICRLAPLDPSTMRALEVCILTGLRRSSVVSAKVGDISGDTWTVRADALKRKVALKVYLTPRLTELLRSDNPEWIFPQPRKPTGRGKPPSHVGESAIGRATWEMPSVPSTSECHARMRRELEQLGATRLELLTDAGASERDGGDDRTYEDGQSAADIRSDYIRWWGDELEPHIQDEMARLDVDAVMAHVMTMRPKSG